MSDQKKTKKQLTITQSKRLGLILRWALAVVVVTFSIFPVLWIVSASLDPVNNLATQKINAG
jgi:arabinogalactan oligomer/maltooligosaccharide transport system permease protein